MTRLQLLRTIAPLVAMRRGLLVRRRAESQNPGPDRAGRPSRMAVRGEPAGAAVAARAEFRSRCSTKKGPAPTNEGSALAALERRETRAPAVLALPLVIGRAFAAFAA